MTKRWILMGLFLFLGVAVHAATPEELDAGKKIYTGKCAKCHKLRDPNKYDQVAWDKWMDKMKKKAKLTDEQFQQLTEYTQTLRAEKKDAPAKPAATVSLNP